MEGTKQTIEKFDADMEKDVSAYEPGREEECSDKVTEALVGKMPQTPVEIPGENEWRYALFEREKMIEARNRNNHIYEVKFEMQLESASSLPGKVKGFMKRMIQKLTAPVMEPVILEQNKFNASVTSSVNFLADNQAEIIDFVKQQERLNRDLQEEVRKLRSEVERMRKVCAKGQTEIIRAKKEVYREVQLLREELGDGTYSAANGSLNSGSVSGKMVENLGTTVRQSDNSSVYGNLNYDKFEGYFRGSEAMIKEVQKIYLPYLAGKQNVLDLGCGRGEFLELLKENGIGATGVEVYPAFIEECREKDLYVIDEDAISMVHNLEDESVDGIFAAQLAEHLRMQDLIQLCQDAYRKLMPGGVLILETPNPTCLSMYTNAFYIDPSHDKPVHPLTLEYIMKEAGFGRTEVLYTESSRAGAPLPKLELDGAGNLEEFNAGIAKVSELIFGSQDYAMIAFK